MSFKSDLDDDLENIFFNLDEFGERAILKPRNGSPNKEIVALPSFKKDLSTVFSPPSQGQYQEAFLGLIKSKVDVKQFDKIELIDVDPGRNWQVNNIDTSEDGRMIIVQVTSGERATF